MEVKQVYDFINSIARQAYGEDAIQATDLTGLIAMGDFVLSSETTKDPYLNTFVDRIGKTVVGVRAYRRKNKSVMMNTFEYGSVMQKISIEPFTAKKGEHWDLADGKTLGTWELAKPKARQKLFSGLTTWQCDVSIPDFQLKSAFTSPEKMSAFIDAVFMTMDNTLEVDLEQYEGMAYCNFIAEKIYHQANEGTGVHVVYLLQDYNSEFGASLTAEQALHTLDFYKYSTQQVKLWLTRMERMSELFNLDAMKRFTPRSEARVTLLTDFVSGVDTYLQSDTFHNELTALPYYTEVPYWQGSGQEYGFGELSAIDITTSSGNVVKQGGVIGLISDIEAVGMTCDNRRTKSAYDANTEITTYFNKADIRYYNDMSENGIVFVVTDTPFAV